MSMEMRTDEEDEVVYSNGLLYGPPKTGKTADAHTAPGRILYLNFESKNATLYARKQAKKAGRLMLIQEPKIPRFEEGKTPIWDAMIEAVNGAFAKRWDTVVVDPIGEMYRRLLEEQTNKVRRPTLDQRGNAWTDLERWIRTMCEAPVHFIVVAHEMVAQKGNDLVSMPQMGSQNASQTGLGPKLMGLVDWIAFTGAIEVEGQHEPKFVAQLQPGKGPDGTQRPAGSRFSELAEEPYREVDLTAWFRLAGLYVPQSTTPASPNGKAAKTTEEVKVS